MPLISLLNDLLKILVVVTVFWSIYNLYLAINWRIRSIKKPELYGLFKLRLKDFLKGFVFLFFFWTYIVVQVYLFGLGLIDSGLHIGENIVCVGIRYGGFCLGKEQILYIEADKR